MELCRSNAKSLSFPTSWAISRAAPGPRSLFKRAFYFLYKRLNQWYHTLKCICTDFLFTLVFPIFEIMTVEHKQKTALEALGETAHYCPLSQRWMLQS